MKRFSPLAAAATAAVTTAACGALVLATPVGADAARMIGGRDIKDNTITGKDVENRSLTGRDIENGSLKAKDFAPGQLPTPAATSAAPTSAATPAAPAPAAQTVTVRFAGTTTPAPAPTPTPSASPSPSPGPQAAGAYPAQRSLATIPANSVVDATRVTFGPELDSACPDHVVAVYLGDQLFTERFGLYVQTDEDDGSGDPLRVAGSEITGGHAEPVTIQVLRCAPQDDPTIPLPVPAFSFDVRLAYTTYPTAPATTFSGSVQYTPTPGPFSRGAEPGPTP